jgi:hypothetical protein
VTRALQSERKVAFMKPLTSALGLVLAMLVASAAAGSGSRPAISFGGPRNSRLGGSPNAIAVADLNADRHVDLAVANGRHTVSVLLNERHGRLRTRHDYRTGRGPFSLAIGDVNGDRKPDLVVANNQGWTISVLLNRGAGRYGPRQDYSTGPEPVDVAVVDVNGDRLPDLVTSNYGDENSDDSPATISVLPGSGGGRFGTRIDYPAPDQPLSLAAGDLNNDGKPDLAVVDEPGVSVFLNTGSGFEAPRNYKGYGASVAVADINRDSKPDLVTNGISVLLNHGDGSFGTRNYDVGYSQGLAVGDVNHDRFPDVVFGEPISPNQEDCDTGDGISVYVVVNKRLGKLGRPLEFSTGYDGCAPLPALGDVGGDGLRDILTANTGSKSVSVLVNAFGRCAVPLMTDSFVSLVAAKRMLQRAGCSLGSVRYAYSRAGSGAVISEHPGWGAVLRKGGKVNLVVSKRRG